MPQPSPNYLDGARSDRHSTADFSAELYAWLEQQIGTTHDGRPIGLSDRLERELLLFLNIRIGMVAKHFASRKRVECFFLDDHSFRFGGEFYQLVVASAPTDPTKLEIILRLISLKRKQQPSSRSIRVTSVGRFRTISVRVDQAFRPVDEYIAEMVKQIVETAYNWLQVQNTLEICSTAPATDSEYYNILRKLFPNKKIFERIKLNAIVSGHGRYLVDAATCLLAHDAASEPLIATPYSPAEVVSDFFLTYIPFDQKFAKNVFKEGRALRADFKHAKYRHNSAVNVSEMNVFKAASIIVHPLVDREQAKLVAGYPAELRQNIYPALEREKPEFERLFDNGVPEVSIFEPPPQPHFSVIEAAANTAGAFTGSLLAHFLNHFPEGK